MEHLHLEISTKLTRRTNSNKSTPTPHSSSQSPPLLSLSKFHESSSRPDQKCNLQSVNAQLECNLDSSSNSCSNSCSNSPLESAIDPPKQYLFPQLARCQQPSRQSSSMDASAGNDGHELLYSEQKSGWRRWLMWLAEVKVEKHGKRRLLISLIFYLICGYINVIFCNIAEYRREELYNRGVSLTLVLPDLGHEIIPHTDIPYLPDYFILTLGVATFMMVMRHKHRLGLLRRLLYVHGSLLLFRSLTIISTTLPDPQKKCSLPRPIRPIFQSFNPFFSDTCGDLIFSGHTVVLTLLAMVWMDYGPCNRWTRCLIWLNAAGGMLSLLSTRYHYSIDVVIAFYLAKRGWITYGMITKHSNLRSNNPVIQFLERRSSEKDFEELSRRFKFHKEDVAVKVKTLMGKREEVGKELERLLKEWQEGRKEKSKESVILEDMGMGIHSGGDKVDVDED